MWITALALFGCCAMAWVGFDQLVSRRLHKLLSFTEGMAGGRFDAPIALRGADELARLGRALAATAAELKSRTRAQETINARLNQEANARQEPEQISQASPALVASSQRVAEVQRLSAGQGSGWDLGVCGAGFPFITVQLAQFIEAFQS